MKQSGTKSRIASNPFYVIGVPPDSTRAEVEREGQKLLGMLELGLSDAATFQTPLGPRERTADLVREAMAELRDPQKRLVHELWGRLDPGLELEEMAEELRGEDGAGAMGRPGPWLEARAALGWRRR